MMDTLRTLVRFFESVGQVAAVVLLVVVVVGVVLFIWLGMVSRKMPPSVSPTGGPLRSDGAKPNWVSSTVSKNDPLHYIAPRACAENPIPTLIKVLGQGKYTVVAATERYIQATARSSRFGFVDDLEFLYDPAAGLLHMRSASRVGHSDLGVNRHRLEAIVKDAGL
ncbi:DUF1499 domain-containing protein [Desulfovibrio sp. TomC]|uniref:DUF1499 domain-containing protein n=1 Tax=Desulfovibrio sp. TomC TaxID=1562888 RepID=UPI0005730FD5|nr:DUF1499 domain-containing protein [Desulfovibrio sp. TomC]KHK03612.1 hypothetical protein NY78_0668 [Desulfovibrio sp. TomC]